MIPSLAGHMLLLNVKEADGELQYVLYDGDGSKRSANGVFLNGNDRRVKECYLKENDTIQVGTTKLVFKVKKDHRSIAGELEEIMRTDLSEPLISISKHPIRLIGKVVTADIVVGFSSLI